MQSHTWSHIHLGDKQSLNSSLSASGHYFCTSHNYKAVLVEKGTHHGTLLVWEVDADGAARLGVRHFAVI